MMKKFTLLLAILTYGLTLSAQTTYFREDFETETIGNPPSLFTVLNEDACSVNQPAFFSNESFMVRDDDTQGNVAVSMSWTVPSCTVDDWLITPAIDLTSASATTKLSWLAKSNDGYPESYEVKISTTGNNKADFTTNLFTTAGEAEVWAAHTVNLAAYIGDTVYLAFRLISFDADVLSIDEIVVSEPSPYNLEVKSINVVNGVDQAYYIANFKHEVVDFSDRTAVNIQAVVLNSGTVAVDTVYVTLLLANDAFTEGDVITDTVYMNPALAPDSSYTHTFATQNLTTLIPTLATDEPINFEVSLDSSQYNRDINESDAVFKLIFAPTVSYTVPYSASFEIASGQSLNFDHNVFGWKYKDNDNDGNSLFPYSFTNIETADGDYSVLGSITGGSNLSISAINETVQSPEFTLEAGKAYQFSLYASTFPGTTGALPLVLTDGANSATTNIGTISLAAADTIMRKFTFQRLIPITRADYLININKTATGFTNFDLFEIVELATPTAPTVSNTWAVCTGTATLMFNIESGNSYSVNWGDGSPAQIVTSSPATHVYTTVGTTYTATVTSSNILGSANGTSSVNATAVPAPVADFTVGQAGTADNSVEFISLGVLPCFTYEWIYGDGATGTGASSSHTYTANGTFEVFLVVTAPSSESSTISKTVTVTGVGIETINFVNGINVFPNPATDKLNVAFELNSAQNVEMTLVSIDGKVVSSTTSANVTNVNTSINTSNLSTGLYILNVTTNEGKFTRNIMVK